MTNEEYGKVIAKNLKRLAYDAGKLQMDIAKDLNISKATISAWMNGTRIPKMESVDMLARYFGVTRNEIMLPDIEVPYPDDIKPLLVTSAFENNLIQAYRNASDARKEAVRVLLGLQDA